jgi:hypothetical protein
VATALHETWFPQDRRGFWTKRKRTALSMFAILSLLAGIAMAFKMFDQLIPNNVVRDASNFDFVIEVFRTSDTSWHLAGAPPAGQPIFEDPAPGGQFPGDTLTADVRIRNTNTAPARDATFFVYVDPASIVVTSCTGPITPAGFCQSRPPVSPSDPNYTKFLNAWTLSVDKEKVLTALGDPADVNENDHSVFTDPVDPADHDRSGFSQQDQVCSGGLKQISKLAPCNLGTARSAGSTELGQSGTLQPTDTRWYQMSMKETDDGSDQSLFKGWRVIFTLVFQARVPAIVESGLITER